MDVLALVHAMADTTDAEPLEHNFPYTILIRIHEATFSWL
jgi:hypothetical protein